MNHDDDDLTGVFDHLTPDDFLPPATTAIQITDLPDAPHKGRRAFERFVKTNLDAVRTSYLAAEGMINPVAMLSSPSRQWMFTPDQDETMGDYVARLRNEAMALGASWLFISRKTLVGSLSVTKDDIPDTTSPEAMERAVAEGRMVEGVFYYAERVEKDDRQHLHGIMRADVRNNLSEPAEGPPEQTVTFFASILG